MALLRPQPIGIFELPAGYLVLPAVPGAEAVRDGLLQGRAPDEWPDGLAFYGLALAGDVERALNAIADDGTPEAAYNRFVLNSDPRTYHQLAATLSGDLAALLHIVAFTLGYDDRLPDGEGLTGEWRALWLIAQAARHLEGDAPAEAVPLLQGAADAAGPVSPLLAAQALGTLAHTLREVEGVSGKVAQLYRQAVDALDGSGLDEPRAELWLNLAMTYHELAQGGRGALVEAVKCYQQAVRVLTRERHPELFALAHNNLALAYLAMPMTEAGDALRMGVAVGSLREALKVYTRETHPERWAGAQLNLANALQYLPSAHPLDNLEEAIRLYDEVLAVRGDDDPLGRARVLASQGNALAHLGDFARAVPILESARDTFTAHGEADSAAAVQGVLDDIEAQVAEKTHSSDGVGGA